MPRHISDTLISGFVGRIKHHKDAIAKHRDALRDIYDDLEAVLESTDTGLAELESAVQVLSEQF